MKFTETNYGNPMKTITKFPDHYVALAITVDATGVTANADGKKIVPAGTIIGSAVVNKTILGDDVKGKAANDATAEGVLFTDVDVTHGDAAGSLLVHGFVDLNKIPTAPDATAVAVLKQITFLK